MFIFEIQKSLFTISGQPDIRYPAKLFAGYPNQ